MNEKKNKRYNRKSNNSGHSGIVGTVTSQMDRDNKILIADADRREYIEVIISNR